MGIMELKKNQSEDEKMNFLMGKQLDIFKKRVMEKDEELKKQVEFNLHDN